MRAVNNFSSNSKAVILPHLPPRWPWQVGFVVWFLGHAYILPSSPVFDEPSLLTIMPRRYRSTPLTQPKPITNVIASPRPKVNRSKCRVFSSTRRPCIEVSEFRWRDLVSSIPFSFPASSSSRRGLIIYQILSSIDMAESETVRSNVGVHVLAYGRDRLFSGRRKLY